MTVNIGHSASMTSRQRVLAAAHRRQPDRVPRHIGLEWHVVERLQKEVGANDLSGLIRNDTLGIGPKPTVLKNDYSSYFATPNVTWDEWGRGRIWDEGRYYAEYLYPLEHAETIDELASYPWPDLREAYRYEGLAAVVENHQQQGYAVIGHMAETVFEIAWQLRSLDRLSEDLLTGDEMGTYLLDRIAERRVAAARAYALAGVDIIEIGDDVAMQTGLMMSRKMFNHDLRPRFEQCIAAAREINPEILIWYHSDGKIDDLIPDLIATGINILNPVQPECVDHMWVKATYGERLAFSGGLGVQSVLPFGTTDQVREHVRRTIASLGAGGGLIVGPSHVVESDVPTANILAMLKAIDDFGGYEG
ncbi:MAG: uroporphyrinogen decarboxylase family protein [Capsulimonadaceae bacterium]|nr:uroporphyrinogen decarboxylase family protein [Capsulimonadaceae bacterium]